ncbi:MAG: AraC family transcriptional regulator [Clostridia bacterium]|nr:AraC family transcriptional regulator [Clostridia bacterium]
MANDRTKRISKDAINGIYVESDVRDAGFFMPSPHCHPYFELFYIENGACRFFIENNMYELKSGDFLFIPPQVFHYTRYLYGNCKKTSLFFRSGDVDGRVKELLPQGSGFFANVRVFETPETHIPQINDLILRMLNEEKIADAQTEVALHVLFQELFLLCLRECTFLELPTEIHTTDRQIVRAAQFISERYGERIATADVAAAVGYSPNYLTHKFKEAVGTGVHEYLAFIRLQKAARELVSTKDKITDIALRCGFSDSNYFKDAFKKKYGVTPREYRK